MRNSPGLPIVALGVAAVLAVIAAVSYATGPSKPVFVLSEAEIGLTAWALTLTMYGLQGVVSVLIEGRELRPGTVAPRLTDSLSAAVAVLGLLLVGVALVLAGGIVAEWEPWALGLLAGVGCLDLALLFALSKPAFVGAEVRFDERNDGVPW